MATKPPAAVAYDAARAGVRPTDTALRLPYATGDLYVAPQPASAADA